MGLISWTLGLPLQPLRGLIKLGEVLQEQVDRELHDPTTAQRQLEDVAQARASGRMSEEEEQQRQQQILDRMIARPGHRSVAGPGKEERRSDGRRTQRSQNSRSAR